VAGFVDRADVAGPEPAAAKCVVCPSGIIEIAVEKRSAPHQDLALDPWGADAAIVSSDAQLVARQGRPT
jgi:hypothetical protein